MSHTGITRWIPALGWLFQYERRFLRGDLLAGVTLAAYLVPAAIGDVSLAGLSPESGLYACLYSGLVFWLFCSSRHTVISVTSAISLLLGSSLGEMSGGDSTRFGALAAATAMLVAMIAFLTWTIRAGAIVRFISEAVMVGFKCGVALYLFNIDHVHDQILNRTQAEVQVPGLVILDLSAAPYVDLQSTHTLAELSSELTKLGTRLQVVEARSKVRDRFRNEGVDVRLGGVSRSISVADAVMEFQDVSTQTPDASDSRCAPSLKSLEQAGPPRRKRGLVGWPSFGEAGCRRHKKLPVDVQTGTTSYFHSMFPLSFLCCEIRT